VFFNGWNTRTETKLVVCVDKDWGVPGCRLGMMGLLRVIGFVMVFLLMTVVWRRRIFIQ